MMNSEAVDYSKTLNLPVTDFPMRANLPTREPEWVKRWLERDVYGELRKKRMAEGAGKYIVHLGPPYANGNFHMGHALTYVLKDFVVRSKFMSGLDSPYAPGWDCHGLPIEWKVEQDLRAKGKTKHDVSKAELRKLCRDYAQHWVNVQKGDWQRLGALADWDKPYMTMAPHNEAGTVRELGKLVARGLVEKGLRSTQWSWAEETAMAEAEVEYKDVTSTAVYVALPIVGKDNEFLVIWTTTPWTLPANRAVAVKADEDYVLLRVKAAHRTDSTISPMLDKMLWVAKGCVEQFKKEVLQAFPVLEEVRSVSSKELQRLNYLHPLFNIEQSVVEGFHVTTDAGTGLVHIAPAHGAEDFQIGKEVGLDLRCPVDGAGKYEAWVDALPLTGEVIAGKLIWPMQKLILKELEASGRLLSAKDFQHSYPVSWRSKEKLIFRSTEQWFVMMDGAKIPETGKTLRESSLDRIYARDGVRGVQWVPQYGMNRIGSMIEGRPDWCISRQRVWGVPITIFMDKMSGEMVKDYAVFEHVASLMEKEGIDAWDNRIEAGKVDELFPEGWLKKHGKSADDFTPVRDILDVWFDSGTTHAHVLRAESGPGQRFHREDGKRPADLYQEGSDQHRGWFHSSLLTSVANYGDAPYESVVTSGFVVDGEGRKFSKSLGNGVEPSQLLQKYGMDIIRLWVASSDYSEDIRYSPQIMEGMADAYRRFRNTFRWLLGNLNGFGDKDVDLTNLPELERYMLHRLGEVLKEVKAHYDAFQFHRGYRVLYEFCGTDLSNFYFDVRKDVLYCDAKDSAARKACQSVLVKILRGLGTYLAPLLSFTTDEVWRARYGDEACVHLETYEDVPTVEVDNEKWETIFDTRDIVNQRIEEKRVAGEISSNATAGVLLPWAHSKLLSQEGWALVLGVSHVDFNERNSEQSFFVSPVSGHKCPRCWRYYGKLEQSGVCLRCEGAIA